MASSASLSWSPPPPVLEADEPTLASTDTRSSAGDRPPLLGHPDEVPPHLRLQLRPLLLGALALAGDHGLGPLEEAGPLRPVDPQQLADDLQGEGDGQRLHDVDRLAASMGSISALALAVTPASIRRTIEGLKPGWTSRR